MTKELPEPLRDRADRFLQDNPALAELGHETLQQLRQVVGCSEFAMQLLQRDASLLSSLELDRQYGETDWQRHDDELGDQLGKADGDAWQKLLRQFRNREMLRIAWRDLAGLSNLDESLNDLSTLADICIRQAVALARLKVSRQHGIPKTSEGHEAEFVVIGMGKLGGNELNFSSDVDLICLHDSSGETDGNKPLDNAEYFARVIREVIRLLSERTADGFVYRVDIRLRPFGDSGPMCMNFSQAEQYYGTHGRDWERYAWVKARAIVGSEAAVTELMGFMRPFVYRKYLDYGAYAAIREMKAMIDQEVRVRGDEMDIKRGRGGIREIEFIAQAVQLVRGGQERRLQERELQRVLPMLAEAGYLPEDAVQELTESYVWLRYCENRLQSWADEQTHDIPTEGLRLVALAWAMDCEDGDTLLSRVDAVRKTIRQHFDAVFEADESADDAEACELRASWKIDEPQVASLADALRNCGIEAPDEVARRLQVLRTGAFYRGLPSQARECLHQLLPDIVDAALAAANPAECMLRMIRVLEAIGGRTPYLTLLAENQQVRRILARLCAASPWITQMLAQQPILLDELLDPRSLEQPPNKKAMQEELAQLLADAQGDGERETDALRRMRQTNMLRIAAADVLGHMRLMVVSDYLTDLAEVCVQGALQLAQRHMQSRYGLPMRKDGSPAEFVIIAFGKLGGIELGYGSDLDLVFLHDADGGASQGNSDGERSLDNQSWYTKLGQRLIHLLSQPTAAGVAYEVDMRLRPSGSSGLLVSSLDVYAAYQRNKAWLWEHQALVRARAVSGSEVLGRQFADLRREILCQERDAGVVRAEVAKMRQRMRQELEKRENGVFDLKQGQGGITDIEFLVQCLLLINSVKYPELIEYTDNIRQLEALQKSGLLDEGEQVADAYRQYRRLRHALDLQESPVRVADSAFTDERELIIRLWKQHVAPE